jgi:hypothetical protein
MDEQDRYWIRPTFSSTRSAGAKPPGDTRKELSEQERAAWIALQARQVYGSYRKDDFADPEVFLKGLCEILMIYPDAVVRDATSHTSGIQTHCKFPPSIAEVKDFCDDLERRSTSSADWEARARRQLAERVGEPRRIQGPPPGKSYEEMTKAHPGRVVGAFDPDRQFVYGGSLEE